MEDQRMWTWSLNWGEVTPRVVIGACPRTPSDLRRIRDDAGVSAVFSLQHDACHAYWSIDYARMCAAGAELGLVMDRCPILDFNIPDMRRQLPSAVAGIARLVGQGHRTYIHCTAGLGRAPLAALGYLTLVERWDPEAAIDLILKGRPSAVPAWEAYHGCREDLIAAHRESIEKLAYEFYERGVPGGAEDHWCRAQAEVLHAVLGAGSREQGAGSRE